jgi:hypothetical protein
MTLVRTLIGLVAGAVVGTAVLELSAPLLAGSSTGLSWLGFYRDLKVVGPGIIIVGTPIHLILCRLSRTRWYDYGAAGLLVGFVAFSFLMSLSFYGLPATPRELYAKIPMVPLMFRDAALHVGPAGGLSGAIIATIFWAVTRPDIRFRRPA